MMWIAVYLVFFVGLASYWYPWCCCGDPPPCGNCTADSDNVSVTISGFSAGTNCTEDNCNSLEGTYVLSRGVVSACWWQMWYTRWCDTTVCAAGGWYTISLKAQTLPLSGNLGWVLTLRYEWPNGSCVSWVVDTATYVWDSGDTADFDCTATHSLSHSGAVLPFNSCTGWTALTIQVN